MGENRGKYFNENPMVFGGVLVRDSLTLSNGLRQGYTLQNGTPIPLCPNANFEKAKFIQKEVNHGRRRDCVRFCWEPQ